MGICKSQLEKINNDELKTVNKFKLQPTRTITSNDEQSERKEIKQKDKIQSFKYVKEVSIDCEEISLNLMQRSGVFSAGQISDNSQSLIEIPIYSFSQTNLDNGMKEECIQIKPPSLVKMKIGPITLPNGLIYEGDWVDGLREGYGVALGTDGSRYEGQWLNDLRHGMGMLTFADGDTYEGEFKSNKAEGWGIYIKCDGTKYEGNVFSKIINIIYNLKWLGDKQHGEGIETLKDQTRYEGNYLLGEKSGRGKIRFDNGSEYVGEFLRNEIDGQGRYCWSDGRVYEGQWKNNKMNGLGQLVWPDGRKFTGNYIDDIKVGKGIIEWGDGRKFEGKWENGKSCGICVYELQDGTKLFGEWKNGIIQRWIKEEEIIEIYVKNTKNSMSSV